MRVIKYSVIILIIIKLILKGLEPEDAVSQVASNYAIDFEKLWSLLPDIYK